MKLKLLIGTILGFLIVPTFVLAAEFRTNDNISVGKSEVINDDVYIAGNNITIEGTINGDLFIAGNNIDISGNISGSAYIAGSLINLSGNIDKSLKIASGNCNISGKIGTDLFIGSGSTDIKDSAIVGGEVYVASGSVLVSGKTGPIKASTENLTIKDTAQVNGNVTYWSNKDLIEEPGSTVSGEIIKKAQPANRYDFSRRTRAATSIASILFTIIVAFILVLLFPKKSVSIISGWKDDFGLNLLWGLLFIILLPIAAILLMVTIIGIPFGIGLLLVFPIFLYLGKMVGIVSIGSWLAKFFKLKESKNIIWLGIVIGAILYALLSFVPVLGGLVKALIVLSGLGLLVKMSWELLKRR